MVAVELVAALVPMVAKVLATAAGTELGLRDIWDLVKDREIKFRVKGREKVAHADTFDVRDAVNELVAAGEAEFVQPGYKVRLKEPGEALAAPATPAPAPPPPAVGEPKP
jgi:hypothetical protein